MIEADFQALSTVQSENMPKPATMASAATIAPTTFLTKLTGTVGVNTITPPVAGCHMLAILSDGIVVFGTTGNILVGGSGVVGRPNLFIYDPVVKKYHMVGVV